MWRYLSYGQKQRRNWRILMKFGMNDNKPFVYTSCFINMALIQLPAQRVDVVLVFSVLQKFCQVTSVLHHGRPFTVNAMYISGYNHTIYYFISKETRNHSGCISNKHIIFQSMCKFSILQNCAFSIEMETNCDTMHSDLNHRSYHRTHHWFVFFSIFTCFIIFKL